MDDDIDSLLVEVRADTKGFAADIADMRKNFDRTVVDGFASAGDVLEKSLLAAVRKGSVSFKDLKQAAFSVFDQIASQALQLGLDALTGGQAKGADGGLGALVSGGLGALFGLPGRAMGGEISPGRPFLVGERGPELFVPTSAGRVEAAGSNRNAARDVRVAINLNTPRGTQAPVALQRSSRQMASAVARVLRR